MIVFIMILVIAFIFILFYTDVFNHVEKFISCDKIPSGPYKNKCSNIHYSDNILYALCPKREPENVFKITKLDLVNCVNDSNDCDSINIDWDGNLICE